MYISCLYNEGNKLYIYIFVTYCTSIRFYLARSLPPPLSSVFVSLIPSHAVFACHGITIMCGELELQAYTLYCININIIVLIVYCIHSQGFKYFALYLRGREELICRVLNEPMVRTTAVDRQHFTTCTKHDCGNFNLAFSGTLLWIG